MEFLPSPQAISRAFPKGINGSNSVRSLLGFTPETYSPSEYFLSHSVDMSETIYLPQCLIKHDPHCCGKVEAPHIPVVHGDGKGPVQISLYHLLRQPRSFLSEHQIIPSLISCLTVRPVNL